MIGRAPIRRDPESTGAAAGGAAGVVPRVSALAPFRVRSFRYQWPADLVTSWAFEMETLILGWYVLVETGSVLMLTVYASLQYLGTIVAPMIGVMGDRIGHRKLLCAMRFTYATLAGTTMTLALLDVLAPIYVLGIAAMMGLVRPSDIGMRAAVIGETMPPAQLLGAMSIQRTTQDSARIAGALSGAGLAAALGIGPAYFVIASLYVTSAILTRIAGGKGAERPRAGARATVVAVPRSAWSDLKEGFAYVRRTPHLLALMCLAFLLNLSAFPLTNGLLPYVAKELYQADRTTLGYMVASAACGALTGSIILSRHGGAFRPARLMLGACVVWYTVLFVFSHLETPAAGIPFLVLAGFMQSMSQIPMASLLLRNSDPRFRGRVMGIRMLALNGNLPGLLSAGPLIASFGYPVTASLYCSIGLAFTLFIAVRWRAHLWRLDAPVNSR